MLRAVLRVLFVGLVLGLAGCASRPVRDAPAGWPRALWDECWRPVGWIDFTSPAWTSLPADRQIAFARAYQRWYAAREDRPVVRTIAVGDAALTLVLVPPGRFWMGSEQPLESPRHRVLLARPYYLGETEVTQAQWEAVMGKTPRFGRDPPYLRDPQKPAIRVNWGDCRAFCRKTGLALPSEAQWEYACRAGTTSRYAWGDAWDRTRLNSPSLWADRDLITVEDYERSGFGEAWRALGAGPLPVKSFAPNAFGLHDMLGNVMEWCEDTEHASYDEAPTDGRAWVDPSRALRRVARGGGWGLDPARYCRSAARGWPNFTPVEDRDRDLGFRVVAAAGFLEKAR
jgi:formylglycine-generating enzyme required for sulfatase activity